jgi:hypothetical protein
VCAGKESQMNPGCSYAVKSMIKTFPVQIGIFPADWSECQGVMGQQKIDQNPQDRVTRLSC